MMTEKEKNNLRAILLELYKLRKSVQEQYYVLIEQRRSINEGITQCLMLSQEVFNSVKEPKVPHFHRKI